MPQVEEIDNRHVSVGHEVDLEVLHESRGCHPEVIAHHHDRLDVLAVALAQRTDQFRALISATGEEPLLELIKHNEDLAVGGQRVPAPERGQSLDQAQIGIETGKHLADRLPQPGHRIRRGCLDVDRLHAALETGQQPGLHQ